MIHEFFSLPCNVLVFTRPLDLESFREAFAETALGHSPSVPESRSPQVVVLNCLPVRSAQPLRLCERLDLYGVSIYPVRQSILNVTRSSSPTGLETLDEFANDTGGRPDQGKDIGAAIAQAMNDVRGSYHVGYYRAVAPADGKFHKLRVTCTRKGVRIQVKSGYFSWPGLDGGDAQEIMGSAMETHFDASEIALGEVYTISE